VAKDEAVNIIKILNAYGYIGAKTSQVAELEAFIQAAHIFLDNGMNNLMGVFALRTDSSYVVEGVNNHIHVWASNKWRKADGSPLANVTYWKKIYELIRAIEEKEQWVGAMALSSTLRAMTEAR
jgi:ribonuclease HI